MTVPFAALAIEFRKLLAEVRDSRLSLEREGQGRLPRKAVTRLVANAKVADAPAARQSSRSCYGQLGLGRSTAPGASCPAVSQG
jgi:hypothetical protein